VRDALQFGRDRTMNLEMGEDGIGPRLYPRPLRVPMNHFIAGNGRAM